MGPRASDAWSIRDRPLLGCAVNSGNSRIAELAGLLGFDVVWIDIEHASADIATAEDLCRAVDAAHALPLVRTAGTQREHILHALEIGARMIIVPLVNNASTAQAVVRHAKFPPLGERGFNTRSRAASYGAVPVDQHLASANDIPLLVQIESMEAIESLDRILDVQGVDGIFVGPGDLSLDMGIPGQFSDPGLGSVISGAIEKARRRGKMSGILTSSPELLDVARLAGADLMVVASDFGSLISSWRALLMEFAPPVPGSADS